jgi:hypothetical protein
VSLKEVSSEGSVSEHPGRSSQGTEWDRVTFTRGRDLPTPVAGRVGPSTQGS